MSEGEAQRRHPAAVVAGLGLGQVVAFACSFYLMGVLGDAVARDLSVSTAFVFATVSLSLAVPALVAPRVARHIDARGGKPVLLSSHVVLAAGLALTGVAGDGVGLAVAMAVVGAGQALGLSPTPFAILVQLYGEAARRPITGVALIGGLGSTLGWPLTAGFAEAFGWRGACFAWAGVQLLFCLPLSAWLCPRTRGGPRHDAATGAVRWDRTMIQLAVLFACAWFVSTCMSAHLPRLLAHFGLTITQAAAAAGLVGVAAVSVRFLEFTVLRRLNPVATTRAATLMHPAGVLGLLAAGGQAGGAALALGQGAGNGMLAVAKGVLPLSLYGDRDYAYRSAILGRPALIAQVFGPTVFALALERSPTGAVLMTSALCLVMFAMTFGLARRGRPAQETAIA
ncbi:MFS transporter [Phenylobacterium sp.]|uniref:MFS transporter n=1 Tax=Phenylobacterium sp. TaxID=1871053 RepID=UPI00301B6E19